MDQFSDKYLPWFLLKAVPGLGNRLFKRLIHTFDTCESILDASPEQLATVPRLSAAVIQGIQRCRCHREPALKELTRIQHSQIRITTLTDPDYPPLLKKIPDPPPVLFYVGTLLPQRPGFSIVGSRNATVYGLNTAHGLAASLGTAGFDIVSGMARGIDSAAHNGALKAGARTLAILGSGLNRIYPRENKPLFHQIRSQGAVLSEFDLDTDPLPRHFPMRNRIIAGISAGTLVVEAAVKSGSLITARLACEYNREVFAVPGSIQSGKSRGTHALLKQGAKLVETQADILEELYQFVHAAPGPEAPAPEKSVEKNRLFMDKSLGTVYKHLDPYPKHIDVIIESSRMDSGLVLASLTTLEIKGLVHRHPGNYYSRSEE